LLPAAAGAQSRPVAGAAVPALSKQDRAEIRTLVARYAQALGSCAADEYASLFTPDGTFTTDEFRGAKHRETYGPRATLRGLSTEREHGHTEEFCLDGSRVPPRRGRRPRSPSSRRQEERALGAARQRRPLRRRLREDGGRLALQEPRGDDAGAAPSSTPSSSGAPSGGTFTTSDGVRLHYSDTGRGRTHRVHARAGP
jgi:hypothetical protein